MVSEDRVKQYIALWMQLGKPVICTRDDQQLTTSSVIRGQAYSPEFEQLWQTICQAPQHYYLAATPCSIRDLLAGHWDLLPCARCTLLHPMHESVIEAGPCPCQDLPSWPDHTLPLPRQPIDSQDYLYKIQARILLEQALAPGDRASANVEPAPALAGNNQDHLYKIQSRLLHEQVLAPCYPASANEEPAPALAGDSQNHLYKIQSRLLRDQVLPSSDRASATVQPEPSLDRELADS